MRRIVLPSLIVLLSIGALWRFYLLTIEAYPNFPTYHLSAIYKNNEGGKSFSGCNVVKSGNREKLSLGRTLQSMFGGCQQAIGEYSLPLFKPIEGVAIWKIYQKTK
jgi:hypothetical protein